MEEISKKKTKEVICLGHDETTRYLKVRESYFTKFLLSFQGILNVDRNCCKKIGGVVTEDGF